MKKNNPLLFWKRDISDIESPPMTTSNGLLAVVENGRVWEGWCIEEPPTKLDFTKHRIFLDDQSGSDAKVRLSGANLSHNGPRIIYAVESFVNGNLSAHRADLRKRGYTIAPFAYLLAMTQEYGGYWSNAKNNGSGNILCLNLPTPINFGSGDENAGVMVGGFYNTLPQAFYNISMHVYPESSTFSAGIRIFAYNMRMPSVLLSEDSN